MSLKKKGLIICAILFLLMLIIPKYEYAVTSKDGLWEYEVSENNEVTITGYNGSDGDITIPTSIEEKVVTEIGYKAFSSNTTIKIVEIPSSVKSIGIQAFEFSSLESIKLNEGLVDIGYAAFCECLYLKSIDIPNTVTTLGTDWDTLYKLGFVNDTDPKDMCYSEVFVRMLEFVKCKIV